MDKFNVMLAHPKSEKLDKYQSVFIQPKLDGVRAYAKLVDGKVRLFSRNHKEFKNAIHVATQLQPIMEQYPELILDGEIYTHKLHDNFNSIVSLIRKQKPTQIDKFKSASLLQYHLYDVFNYHKPDALYIERWGWLDHIFNYKFRKFNQRAIKITDTKFVTGDEEINKFNRDFLKQGYEGSIVRLNGKYEQKRSKNLQKVKQWKDTEATITGFVEGKGKRRGTVGKFLARDANGIDFGMPVCFDYDQMRKMWDNVEDYVGKIATFIYFEKTPRGSYRFPRFKSCRNYE